MELKDIDKLAELARLDIPESEKRSVLEDLSAILGYVDQIREIAVEQTERIAPVHHNIMRSDEHANAGGEYTEVLLAEAPQTENGYLKVKQIL